MTTSKAKTTDKAARSAKNYMLHDPTTWNEIGKYKGHDFRTAGLKACSKSHGKDLSVLILRETGTKRCAMYRWSYNELETPKVVKKNDKEIIYRRTPAVELVGYFTVSQLPPPASELPDPSTPASGPPSV